MNVGRLIELLQDCDPEAEVRIMMQENWPFECVIDGVATRDEFSAAECDCDHRFSEPHEESCPAGEEPEYGDGLEANDVFIVEGRQERYGNKDAWAISRS